MRLGSCPYVIQVLGVFKGRLPNSGPSAQLGLVMEFMERGSLASLQVTYIPVQMKSLYRPLWCPEDESY